MTHFNDIYLKENFKIEDKENNNKYDDDYILECEKKYS